MEMQLKLFLVLLMGAVGFSYPSYYPASNFVYSQQCAPGFPSNNQQPEYPERMPLNQYPQYPAISHTTTPPKKPDNSHPQTNAVSQTGITQNGSGNMNYQGQISQNNRRSIRSVNVQSGISQQGGYNFNMQSDVGQNS